MASPSRSNRTGGWPDRGLRVLSVEDHMAVQRCVVDRVSAGRDGRGSSAKARSQAGKRGDWRADLRHVLHLPALPKGRRLRRSQRERDWRMEQTRTGVLESAPTRPGGGVAYPRIDPGRALHGSPGCRPSTNSASKASHACAVRSAPPPSHGMPGANQGSAPCSEGARPAPSEACGCPPSQARRR